VRFSETPPIPAEPPVIVNPAFGIWWHPRRTVRAVLNDDPRRHVFWLFMFAGVGQAFDNASGRNLGDGFSLGALLVICLGVAPLIWVGFYWLLSHLVAWTGSFLGGQAKAEEIRAALAWSSLPIALTVPLWFVLVALTGKELFIADSDLFTDEPNLSQLLPVVLASGAMLGMRLWSCILASQAIAEVQHYASGWRGLGNLLLAGLASAAPFVALIILWLLLLKAAH
jgi:hypothetical protein